MIDIQHLMTLAHSPVHNYVVPGLTSLLLGGGYPNGNVRLFINERQHVEPITPHSHRFDFQCLVLDGEVTNRIWREADAKTGDMMAVSQLVYEGSIGKYSKGLIAHSYWRYYDKTFKKGEVYSMVSTEVHSIYFSRGAKVLFFEGPNCTDKSIVLEPVVNGDRIETFKTEPWMFRR